VLIKLDNKKNKNSNYIFKQKKENLSLKKEETKEVIY
jgi:hypothetical protein